MSDNDFSGRVAVVTGAAQGIGHELAGAFASRGASVVIADVNEAAARSAARALERAGWRAEAVAFDVGDESSVAAMVETTVARLGSIDILVNNAAIFSTLKMKPFDEIELDEWNRVLAVNLTGVFLCCRSVWPQMRAQGGGRIINMSSATVLMGRPNYLHYVTSKSGIVGLTRALATELGSSNVTVNTVMPGSVDTGIERDSATPQTAAAIVERQALSRRLVPADIVGPILFLASDAASAITGQTVVADGGMNFL